MLTATAIQRVLSSCRFNPRKPGTDKIKFDIDDPRYFMQSAVICLQEALINAKPDYNLRMAIKYIAAALVLKYGQTTGQKKRKTRSEDTKGTD